MCESNVCLGLYLKVVCGYCFVDDNLLKVSKLIGFVLLKCDVM